MAGENSRHRSFDGEVAEIAQKFMDGLQLALSIWIGAHKRKNAKPPQNYDNFISIGKSIDLMLVIKKTPHNLTYIEDEIKRYLLKEYKLWRFDVRVLDENFAQEQGLVIKVGAAS